MCIFVWCTKLNQFWNEVISPRTLPWVGAAGVSACIINKCDLLYLIIAMCAGEGPEKATAPSLGEVGLECPKFLMFQLC